MLNYKNKIKINEIIKISESSKEISIVLLLHNSHNLICSYGEKIEIFESFFTKEYKSSKKNRFKIIQNIIEPNFNNIEYLYETKINQNNKNYLLICSDMIHVYYLYENDKKSILLQSINQFAFQFIIQIIEKRNGDLISISNEYKISTFNNSLIKNDEIIDYDYIINKNDESFRDEIYELEKDKLNKNNEKIVSVLELFPDGLAYAFNIYNNEIFYEQNMIENNINDIDEDYIYIKFLNNNYVKIKELKVCNFDDNFYGMFQYNEKILIIINDDHLSLIDLKNYEIVTKVMTNRICFANYFQSDFSKNNYLLLGIKMMGNSNSSGEENSVDENLNININDLINIMKYGKIEPFNYECKNEEIKDKEINLNSLLNIFKILEISISRDNDNKNIYYIVIYAINENTKENDDLSLIFLKLEIPE